ncbi:MAG: ribose-phosphate pyrophosphokinase [Candidatus Gottesmanbacteria bacterium]
MKDYLLFAGSSNHVLAERIAQQLHINLGSVELTRFADGEVRPWIQEDVRDKTVFVLQSFSNPMDQYIIEMALMGDAIRRSAPKTMIAIIPYMGYSRQDKQHRVGEPISSRVIAKLIEVSKFKEVIVVDLHNDAIVGFFQIPVMHISAMPVFVDAVKKLGVKDPVVVSPDVGGVRRARNFAYQLDADLIVMEKKRFIDRHDTSENFQIIGDVKGRTAIINDDIISTGGTIKHGAEALRAAGATSVIVCASHAVLAGDVKQNLEKAQIDHLIVTDTIVAADKRLPKGTTVISVAPIIASAISTITR